jgi:hypothetical protein
VNAQRLLARLLLLGAAAAIVWVAINRDRMDLETLDAWLSGFGILAPFAFLGLYAVGTIAFLSGALFALAGGRQHRPASPFSLPATSRVAGWNARPANGPSGREEFEVRRILSE